MKHILIFQLFSLALIQINGLSILNDNKDDQGTQKDETTVSTKRLDILQQLLNQETIIRMSLEKSVRDLMKEILDMKKQNGALESLTENLRNDMKRIQVENQKLQSEMFSQLIENVTKIGTSVPELLTEKSEEIYRRVNRSLKILNDELVSQHEELSKNVSSLEKIYSTDQGSKHLHMAVAFYAKMTSFQYHRETSINNIVVIFEEALLNNGNAYNTSSGKFTAPIDGTYSFDWTTLAKYRNFLVTYLVRDGTVITSSYCGTSDSDNHQCSSSAIVEMKVNQMVWIRTDYNKIGGMVDNWSFFAGHILF